MVYLTKEFDNLFNTFFYSFPREDPKPPIAVEMVHDDEGNPNGAKIQFAVAGFHEEDLDVYFEGRTLVIEGDNIKRDAVAEKFKCAFSRKISIRENLDLDNASISLKNGILNIFLPVHDPKKNRTYLLGKKD